MTMDKNDSNRQKALDDAMKKIERNFGKGSIMKMGERGDTRISTVPTGSLTLDISLGVGGYPRGRIIEVYGPESSVKRLFHYMQLRKYKNAVVLQPLSMLRMR